MAKRKGIALVVVNLMAVFLIPLVIYLLITSSALLKSSFKEKQLKMSGSLASNVMVDFMRQFSQNYYEGHYDPDALSRAPVFYSVGFSAVQVEASSTTHSIYLHASGKYGPDSASPLADKNLYGTVQFISDLTDYGTMIDGTFNLTASDVVYFGKWWITSDLTISGNNVTFIGGPLIVGGNLRVTGYNVKIKGDLYYNGTLSGSAVVSGMKYNFYPSDMTYPSLDDTYYRVNYNYKIPGTTDRTLKFNAYSSSSTFNIVGTTITVPIYQPGMIIYAENINLVMYGTVRGRVTVVTSNTNSSKGRITMGTSGADNDLLYYNPLTGGTTTSAASGSSFAAIASNGITFQGKNTGGGWGGGSGADLTVCGVYFDMGPDNMSANGNSSYTMYLYGTRNKPVTTTFDDAMYTYDVWLNKTPPPGLPERPVLVSWHLR